MLYLTQIFCFLTDHLFLTLAITTDIKNFDKNRVIFKKITFIVW